MDEILKESAKQAPALCILAGVCILFAKSGALVVKSFLTQMSESRGEYLKAIERFQAENLEARNDGRQTLHENSVASDKQTAALTALTNEVRELRASLNEAIRHLRQQS